VLQVKVLPIARNMSGYICLMSWVCFKLKKNIHLIKICQSPVAHGPHCSYSACACLVQVVHVSSFLYKKAWSEIVIVNDGNTSAQLRLLFYGPACQTSGEPATLQLALARWYEHFN